MNTVTVPASGIVPNSNAATFGSAGTYYWQAVYSGDANNNGDLEPVHGGEQRAADGDHGLADHRHHAVGGEITAGSTAHDTATLSGAGTSTGTATVAYSYYTNNTCSTGEVAVNTVTVPASGIVPNSNAVDLQQRRDLLLAGGLQRRRQQQR